MKVAFLFLHPFEGSLGSAVRVRELTSHLHNFGIDSLIITPYENDYTICNGVQVVSVGGKLQKVGLSRYLYNFTKKSYYNPFFIKYFMSNGKLLEEYAKISATSIIKVLKENGIKILVAEQDFALPIAIEIKKQTELPVIVDLHNITSEELVASGAIKYDSAEFKRLQKLLKNNLTQVREVIVVSDLMKNYVVSNYDVPVANVHVVPPGGNPGKMADHIPSGNIKIVYSGMVSYREHVDLFVKSMPIVQKKLKNVRFYITNKGEDLDSIKKLARKLCVNPIFFWYAKKEEFHCFLSSCDIAVLPSSNDLARKMGTPAKLFDYLSVGLPIVANDVGAWSNIIKNENLGVVTEDNPESFASGILSIASKAYAPNYRARCQELLGSKFSWANSARILADILKAQHSPD